jgi:cytochrome P450
LTEITLTRYPEVHSALCNPALRQSLYDAGEVIMKDVLLTLHGESHKQRRHLELKLFRRNYARYYESEIFPATLAATLDPMSTEGKLDLVEFGYRVTMNLTADFAGLDRPADDPAATDQLLAIVKSFSEGATLVHSTRPHADVISEVKQAQASLQRFLQPSWQRRQSLIDQYNCGEIGEDALPRDILTVLLHQADRLPDDVIEREVSFYLQAGSHSTANAMVHAVHEIFQSGVDLRVLAHDPLLTQRHVHESMRLHPASPVAWRSPVGSANLADGRSVSEDDLIVLDLRSANRDPVFFGKDAEQFNPARTVSGAKVAPYGLTFGTGVHMCTGRDLDGGLVADADTSPQDHQYGIVTLLILTLLARGMAPHPTEDPVSDTDTSRENWGYYPIILETP